jgi:hypothetical protein
MSRGVFIGAALIALLIVVGLYLYGRSGSPPEVTRTSGSVDKTESVPSAPSPPPEGATGPVDTTETGGPQNSGGDQPPQ